jgi:hypothetical protein
MQSDNDDLSTRLRRAWFAWALTTGVLAILGATALPGIRAEPPTYDAMATLTALTVVGLVWAAYFASQTLLYQRNHDADLVGRRRHAVAQAMQVELDRIAVEVSTLAGQGDIPVGGGEIAHPILDRALETPEVFQLQTVRCLAELLHELASLRPAVALFLSERARTGSYVTMAGGVKVEPPFAPAEKRAKDHATLVTRTIAALRAELQNELPTPEPRASSSDGRITAQRAT